jgi:hypothetical protein
MAIPLPTPRLAPVTKAILLCNIFIFMEAHATQRLGETTAPISYHFMRLGDALFIFNFKRTQRRY